MADLMQQARELLAAEYERDGITYVPDCIRREAMLTEIEHRAVRAIAAALRAAPEGYVLVPVQLDSTMLLAWRMAIARGESYQQAWAAALAARPQGVKDGR